MKIRNLLTTVLAVSCLGCAQTYVRLNLDSDPKYATIYETESGAYQGTCPTEFFYNIREHDRANGYIMAKGLTARWPSGATKGFSTLELPINGTDRSLMFVRPAGAPNPEMDMYNAHEIERTKMMKEDAKMRDIEFMQNNVRYLDRSVQRYNRSRNK